MRRWRRLARRGNSLLMCAQRGNTTHGETLWSSERYLAVHPIYKKTTVVPGQAQEVEVGDVMEVDFIPTSPPDDIVRLDDGVYQTISYSCEVIARGMWFRYPSRFPDRFIKEVGGAPVFFPNGVSGLDGCGSVPELENYTTPQSAEAGVLVRATTHYSAVDWPSGEHSDPVDAVEEVIVRIGASMDGIWVIPGLPIQTDSWGSVLNDWMNGGVATFPGRVTSEGTGDVVMYEEAEDKDFPVGVDYKRTA